AQHAGNPERAQHWMVFDKLSIMAKIKSRFTYDKRAFSEASDKTVARLRATRRKDRRVHVSLEKSAAATQNPVHKASICDQFGESSLSILRRNYLMSDEENDSEDDTMAWKCVKPLYRSEHPQIAAFFPQLQALINSAQGDDRVSSKLPIRKTQGRIQNDETKVVTLRPKERQLLNESNVLETPF
ncbi:hypothetical protein, partial, partial [Parasitella parasitica]